MAELEGRLAAYCGARHCVGVSSGTDALQIAMMAEGIGPGDAVFLPAFTYTATAEVPLLLGCGRRCSWMSMRGRFRSTRGTLRTGSRRCARRGGLRPRAQIGVDLFGQPADWPALNAVAEQEGLFTIDDLAQSFGARPARRQTRYPGAGDGDELLSQQARWAPTAMAGRCSQTATSARRCIAACAAMARGRARYEVLRTGMNGRLDTLQAAVLLAKLDIFDEELAVRERIAQIYDRRLGNLLEVPARVPDSTSAWAIYAVLLRDSAQRSQVQAQLREAGVPTAIYLSEAAASPARLMRRSMTGPSCRFRTIWPGGSWRCRSIRICRTRTQSGFATRWRGRWVRATGGHQGRFACMTEQKPHEELPPAGDHPAHNPTGKTPHGVRNGAEKHDSVGVPTSDRQQTETAPAKVEKEK